jgi:hypothetical protein
MGLSRFVHVQHPYDQLLAEPLVGFSVRFRYRSELPNPSLIVSQEGERIHRLTIGMYLSGRQ